MQRKKESGSRCAVKNCLNGSYHTFLEGCSLFRFPKDTERCRLWVAACKNDVLKNKTPLQLYQFNRVCSIHFTNNTFLNDLKNRLQSHALPVQNLPDEDDSSNEVLIGISSSQSERLPQNLLQLSYTLPSTSKQQEQDKVGRCSLQGANRTFCDEIQLSSDDQNISSLSSPKAVQTSSTLSACSPRKTKLRQKIIKLQRRVKFLKNRSASIQDISLTQFKCCVDKFLPSNLASLLKIQCDLHLKKPKGRRYTDAFKKFCLSLYFLSPIAYNFLAKMFYFPNKRTLHKLTEKMQFFPGVNDVILNCLQLKVNSMSELDKHCIDEMSIKAHLYFHIAQDQIIGFENIGNGNVHKPACNVAVIMIRSISSNWKQPIGYFFVHTALSANDLYAVLQQVILKLQGIGLIVDAIVSDMGSNFVQLTRKLEISVEKTYFELQGNKIFYIFDVPHLIKATRNNLQRHHYIFNQQKTNWAYIQEFYEKDKQLNCRLAPKLSDAHVYPSNFQKMKVKLATQVVSSTVAAGINTYVALGAMNTAALETAYFIQNFDQLFDLMNSSNVFSKKIMNKAFRGEEFQLKFLNKMKDMITNLKVENHAGKDITKAIVSLKCWMITINSVLGLWEKLEKQGFTFFFTRRLNQDALENFFGSVRKQCGNAFNPTPIQFFNIFKKSFCVLFTNSGSENCAEDFDKVLTKIKDFHSYETIISLDEDQQSSSSIQIPRDYRHMSQLQLNSLTYIYGYLMKKYLNVHNCDVCLEFANSDQNTLDESNLYSHYKAFSTNQGLFGSLYVPDKSFIIFF